MIEYLGLVDAVFSEGTRKESRTGVDTLSLFGYSYNVDLRKGFPLLTTKFVSWKNVLIENLWFLGGGTNVAFLRKHGCTFWDPWADELGDIPSAYGRFWCDFGDLDQVGTVLDELKRNPMSRRLVISAWDPAHAWGSKLPPCHVMFIFNVQNEPCTACDGDGWIETQRSFQGPPERDGCPDDCHGKPKQVLNLHLTQRSADVALGVPYNLAGYAFILSLFAHLSGMTAGRFFHSIVDAHVYTAKADGSMAEYDHVPGLRQQLERGTKKLPTLHIDPSIQTIEDVRRVALECSTEELLALFRVDGYTAHPTIRFKPAV